VSRAAKLASEAARAEGASLTRHRPWPAGRRLAGVSVKRDRGRRPNSTAGWCRSGSIASATGWAAKAGGWPLLALASDLVSDALDHPDDHPDDPSVSVWTDEASNGSRLDPSGAFWFDGEHSSRNRKVGKSCPRLTTSSWPRSSSGGRFRRVAARLLPGRAIWNGAGPAEGTRQAGDQGCCGVEVRGFEPLASSVRASWG
jgi:hypothetical protein